MKAIILAAGRGTRFNGSVIPKCLLEVNNETPLERLLFQLKSSGIQSITIVLGYEANMIIDKIKNLNYDIDYVFNKRFEEDTNIYSLRLALEEDLEPFLLLESDCVFSDESFNTIVSQTSTGLSTWFTCGMFNSSQNGGIIKSNSRGIVEDIKIVSDYHEDHSRYMKMIGALIVASKEVDRYYEYLINYSDKNLKQYYHKPWIDNLHRLSSVSVDLPENQVFSFNTIDEYNMMLSFFKGK